MAERWAGARATALTQRVLREKGRTRPGDRLCVLQLPGCTEEATTADHIIPKSRGGAFWDIGNLQPCCRHCNSSKGAGIDEGPAVDLPDWLTRREAP